LIVKKFFVDKKIELRVQGLTNSQVQSGAYALILAEENGLRRVPIIVGTAEAQSIAIALENIKPPRPLTHDLFASFTKALDLTLEEVFIYKFEDGVFYSELLFRGENKEIRLDSRTSDAIAIALRVKCHIYTTEAIIRECGVVLDESIDTYDDDEDDDMFDDIEGDLDEYLGDLGPEDMENEEELSHWLTMMSQEKLTERMEDAIAKENYEHAKLFKDELQRRNEEKTK